MRTKRSVVSLRLALSTLVLTCIAAPTLWAAVNSDFDDGTLQGWTPYFQAGSADISLIPTGGNPGGYVRATDLQIAGGNFGIFAPAAFLGDLSGVGGLAWDERLLNSTALVLSTIPILEGPDGTAYGHSIPPGSVDIWRGRFVPFTESAWELIPGSGVASFQDVLQDVTVLRIQMEVNQAAVPTLESDVDNIALVPEPGTIALFALGLTMLRRRIRR